jgi:hypothetical protein
MTTLIALVQKSAALTETTTPLWGSLSAQQMIEHLIAALHASTGKIRTPTIVSERESAIYKQRGLLSEKPLPKNVESPLYKDGMPPLRYTSLAESVSALESELAAFYERFDETPNDTNPHVYYGELNKDEWERFHLKHITHHFTQFGLL